MFIIRSLHSWRSGASQVRYRHACGWRLRSLFLLQAALALLALASLAPSALASGPATVTVRVVGPADEALVPLTTVTTNETPVVGAGQPATDSCSGTSALGALQQATDGDWAGKWYEGLGYDIETIRERTLTTPSYWNFWLDNKVSELGLCGAQLNTGDQVLLFPECFSEKGECTTTPPNVLAIEVPPTAEAKTQVQVTVVSYPNAGGEPKPAAGVTITGGEQSAVTESEGHATVTFGFDNTYKLVATEAEGETAISGEAIVCAHEGNDGTCGTKASSGPTPFEVPASSKVTEGSQTKAVTEAENSIVANATGLVANRHYSRKRAPRTLAGVVFSTSSVTSISIKLRRTWDGRCYDYNGVRGRWQQVRCSKQASFFKIGHNGSSFSYLLPSRLPPGRYVFDVQATNSAGAHTSKGGNSQTVFYVK